MPNVFVQLSQPRIKERSSMSINAYFRDGNAAAIPTTIHYRVDDITNDEPIVGWTSVTPASSVSIAVTGTQNKIISNGNVRERKQITVSSDKGTSTETRDTMEWKVENIRGFDE